MKTRIGIAAAALLLTIAWVGCASTRDPAAPPEVQHEPLWVFLVRHGEKTDAGEDPELSAAGRERAVVLADTLRDAGIEHVHSSDFVRTRSTAVPIAAELGLEVELYDPRDLPALVETLRATGGRHLVVGHSNTTPAVAELLGGAPGPAIDETGEYDRLYIVAIGSDGKTDSVLMRYGNTYDPIPDPSGR